MLQSPKPELEVNLAKTAVLNVAIFQCFKLTLSQTVHCFSHSLLKDPGVGGTLKGQSKSTSFRPPVMESWIRTGVLEVLL